MSDHQHGAAGLPSITPLEIDPVCGMKVDPQKARATAEYRGKKFYFCCQGCADRFTAEPEKFLNKKPASAPLVQLGAMSAIKPAAPAAPAAPRPPAGVIYVCPMDPEVREPKPGPCPKCGMALEPQGVEYTCPMHPEIVRDGPGSCPICGMALEPRAVLTEQEEADPELVDMSRRFWISLVLTIPLLVLSMAEMIPGLPLPPYFAGRALVW